MSLSQVICFIALKKITYAFRAVKRCDPGE